MERTNIYLEASQRRKLRLLSDATGEPVAAIVREAVDEYLAGRGVTEHASADWRGSLGKLLDRRAAVSADFDQEEVDREVQAALREVRAERKAGRRTAAR
jgi:hypothetical protein